MNLLHICCNFAGTKAFAQLFSAMADTGLAQQVYVPEKHAAHIGVNDPARQDLPVHASLIIKPWDRFTYFTKARRAVPDLLSRVALSPDTLLHAHTLFTDGGIAYRLHQTRGTPFVVTVRYTDIAYFFRYMPHLRTHGIAILEAAQRIVFLSSVARDSVLLRYVPKPKRDALLAKTEIVPNGIASSWLDGTPKHYAPGTPLRIAFAGKLNDVKQPLLALAATQALRRHLTDVPICLHVAGEGPLEDALRKGGAVLHGQLDQAALKAFYRESTLFLLPSRAETFGLVYLEAMSQGLPVLYTRGQGFDGQFHEGTVGYAVDPKNVEAVALSMLRALEDYDARSARCIQLAATMTWQAAAQRMLRVYAQAS